MKVSRDSSRRIQGLFTSASIIVAGLSLQVSAQQLVNPILYVTQVPVTAPTNTVVSIGGSHLADTKAAPRGGDLMIYYPSGRLKNLTRLAGYGSGASLQTANAIAVRDPSVHWDGKRALFSMVVGAPTSASDQREFHWQIYEVVGLGERETPVITWVPGQRREFNNIQPAYTSGDKLIFVSDQTLSGDRLPYPLRNEQGGVSVTGLWSLSPTTANLKVMDHSPSGSFNPFVDSFGRVVFSRWDHLQQDPDATLLEAMDYTSESPNAPAANFWSDIFPEPLTEHAPNLAHKFDLFLPWTMNQDGTGLLTMNHLGRHELATAFTRARHDANLVDFTPETPPLAPPGAPTRAGSYLHLSENPAQPGHYLATDAVSTAVSAGRLVTFRAPPNQNADSVEVTTVNFIGLARDASYLSDGRIIGSFAEGPLIIGSYGESEAGTRRGNLPPDLISPPENPFRIRVSLGPLDLSRGIDPIPSADVALQNYIDGRRVTFRGKLWQLQPVEVDVRRKPPATSLDLPEPELEMFKEAGVSPSALKRWLENNELALVVSRNVTRRDKNDRQQPFNLEVPNGVSAYGNEGRIYQVTNLQFFQGDYVRGYKTDGVADPSVGRRVVARVLHDDKGENIPTAISGSAKIAPDGSTAMFLPAGRAVTWQLTDSAGEAVVRERYWLTFQAGEMRSCANCHGNNTTDQLNRPTVTTSPTALRLLLTDWNKRHPEANASVTAYEFWAELNLASAPAADDANGDGLSNFEAFVYGFGATGTVASDPVARPLTPSIIHEGNLSYGQLSFTLNLEATSLRLVVETSANLKDWNTAAVIEDGTPTSNDGSVSITTNSTAQLAARGLLQVKVRELTPLSHNSGTYFRLRFEEGPPNAQE